MRSRVTMPAIQQGRLKVGTDCSGMEAPLQALNNLGVTVEHVFSCDIDEHAKKTIQENYPPLKWYKDLTKRDNERAPTVDLYVAGFPIRGNGGISTPHPAQRIRRGIFGSNIPTHPPSQEGSGWGTGWSTLQDLVGERGGPPCGRLIFAPTLRNPGGLLGNRGHFFKPHIANTVRGIRIISGGWGE